MSDGVLFFKALADETRLRILNLLLRGELCVCDIMRILKVGQSKASRHLAYLRNAGLVVDRREGLWMHYSLAQPSGPFRRLLLAWLTHAKDEIPCSVADLQALRKLRAHGELCAQCPVAESSKTRTESVAVP